MTARVRFAEERDLPELTRIYNHYVSETAITFDIEPYSLEQRRQWLAGFSRDGRHVYQALFKNLAETDTHLTLAGVTLPNDASLALHQRFGFRGVGTFREVGRKFGRFWNVQWLEKRLSP